MYRFILMAMAAAYILFPSQSLAGDIEDKILTCSKLEDNNSRIKCYDDIAKQIPVDESSKENWSVTRKESKIDKGKTVVYLTKSIDKVPNSIGSPESATLVLRCIDNKTETYIVWPAYLGSFDYIDVVYKLDEASAIKERWSPSSDGSAAFSRKPNDFIKKLSAAKTILFKISPHSNVATEAEFNITGAEEALKEISSTCGWEKNEKKPSKK